MAVRYISLKANTFACVDIEDIDGWMESSN